MCKPRVFDNAAFSTPISHSQGRQPFPAFYLVIIEKHSNGSMGRLKAKAVVINLSCTKIKHQLWSSFVGKEGHCNISIQMLGH